jgi:hypothetical protein
MGEGLGAGGARHPALDIQRNKRARGSWQRDYFRDGVLRRGRRRRDRVRCAVSLGSSS